jgi:hypothetical protein
MKKIYIYILLILIIFISLHIILTLSVPTPKTIELSKLNNNNNEFSIVLPRCEGFEPWIAVDKCEPFEINFKIFDQNSRKIFDITLNNNSKQLERLGGVLQKYNSKNICKFPIVQDDRLIWELFEYGKKYKIKAIILKLSKNTKIYLNLDYLRKWFARSTKAKE